jgi:hypothetical protein
MAMKRRGIVVAGALGCVLVVAGAQADTPYQSIVDRNVFGLKPIPVVDPNAAPPPDVPSLKLEGITTILGRKQVIFNSTSTHPAQGEPAQKSHLLNEGEAEDGIEVLSIDDDAGTVKFDNNGTEQILNMKDDVSKSSNGGGAPPPNAAPGRFGGAGGSPIGRRIPQRMIRGGGSGPYGGAPAPTSFGNTPANTFGNGSSPSFGNNASQPYNGGGNPVFNGAGVGTQSLNGGATMPQSAPSQPQQPQMTPEEQTILIELERERTAAAVQSGDAPPLPITEITPPESIPPGFDGNEAPASPPDKSGQSGEK